MGAQFAVNKLNSEQRAFVLRAINDGRTNREISADFKTKFQRSLAKSSLARWRERAGDELAEKYQFARMQAAQLLEDLQHDPEADKYKILMQSIEDRLLSATHDVISHDPVKLLQIRQEEEKRRQKDREIDLKREQIELEREKLRGAALDRVKLGAEFLQDLFEYSATDADGLTFLSKHLQPFGEFLKEKYAAQN